MSRVAPPSQSHHSPSLPGSSCGPGSGSSSGSGGYRFGSNSSSIARSNNQRGVATNFNVNTANSSCENDGCDAGGDFHVHSGVCGGVVKSWSRKRISRLIIHQEGYSGSCDNVCSFAPILSSSYLSSLHERGTTVGTLNRAFRGALAWIVPDHLRPHHLYGGSFVGDGGVENTNDYGNCFHSQQDGYVSIDDEWRFMNSPEDQGATGTVGWQVPFFSFRSSSSSSSSSSFWSLVWSMASTWLIFQRSVLLVFISSATLDALEGATKEKWGDGITNVTSRKVDRISSPDHCRRRIGTTMWTMSPLRSPAFCPSPLSPRKKTIRRTQQELRRQSNRKRISSHDMHSHFGKRRGFEGYEMTDFGGGVLVAEPDGESVGFLGGRQLEELRQYNSQEGMATIQAYRETPLAVLIQQERKRRDQLFDQVLQQKEMHQSRSEVQSPQLLSSQQASWASSGAVEDSFSSTAMSVSSLHSVHPLLSERMRQRMQKTMHYEVSLLPFAVTIQVPNDDNVSNDDAVRRIDVASKSSASSICRRIPEQNQKQQQKHVGLGNCGTTKPGRDQEDMQSKQPFRVVAAGVSESPAYDIHSSFDGRNLLASASSLRPSFDLSSNDAVSASSYTAVNTAGADEAGGSSVVRQEVDSSDNSLRDNCSHEYRHNGNNGGKHSSSSGNTQLSMSTPMSFPPSPNFRASVLARGHTQTEDVVYSARGR